MHFFVQLGKFNKQQKHSRYGKRFRTAILETPYQTKNPKQMNISQ